MITLDIGQAIEEGLLERKQERDDAKLAEEEESKRAEDLGEEIVEAPKAIVIENEEEI